MPREYFGSWNRTYGDWRNTETGSDQHAAVKERGRDGALTRLQKLRSLATLRRSVASRRALKLAVQVVGLPFDGVTWPASTPRTAPLAGFTLWVCLHAVEITGSYV